MFVSNFAGSVAKPGALVGQIVLVYVILCTTNSCMTVVHYNGNIQCLF